jgi:hypothetical protein
MKWNRKKTTLTMLAGIALILPMSAFAQDPLPDEKKPPVKVAPVAKPRIRPAAAAIPPAAVVHKEARANNVPAAAAAKPAAAQQPNVAATKKFAPGSRGARGNFSKSAPAAQQPNAAPVAAQNSQPAAAARSRRNQTQYAPVQPTGSRADNYGGQWFAGNTHRDWDREERHHWHDHDYRWYQGGWLIIDNGYTPYQSSGGSVASSVQASLASLGYYNGPVDGDIGPGTRNAIADYQSDYGLRVTGRINSALLQSLQLQ